MTLICESYDRYHCYDTQARCRGTIDHRIIQFQHIELIDIEENHIKHGQHPEGSVRSKVSLAHQTSIMINSPRIFEEIQSLKVAHGKYQGDGSYSYGKTSIHIPDTFCHQRRKYCERNKCYPSAESINTHFDHTDLR